MKLQLFIDGMLSGTGVRDGMNGGYIALADLGLPEGLAADISAWHTRYEEAHFSDFPQDVVASLDEEGLVLADRLQKEFPDSRVGYFSNGLMKRLL